MTDVLAEHGIYRSIRIPGSTRVEMQAWKDGQWHAIATTALENESCWRDWCDPKLRGAPIPRKEPAKAPRMWRKPVAIKFRRIH